MATLAELRKQYPQYNDLSDQDFADGFYQKFYSDMPKDDFYSALGMQGVQRGRPTMQSDPRIVDANAPAPTNDTSGATRGLGLGARSVLKGLTSIDYPVRAGFDAVSVIPSLLGYKDAAARIHNTLGTGGSAGGAMADLAGLPTPQTRTEKAIGGATEGVTGLLTGGALQKGVQAATGAVSPILSAIAPTANTAKEAAVISGIQGGLEAAPEVAVPLLATAMGVKGAKGAINSHLDARAEKKLFGNSATPAADAQVILDLNKLKNDPGRFQQVTGDQAIVGRANAVGIGSDYKDQVRSLLKQGGIKNDEIDLLLKKKNVTSTDIANLDATPEGKATASALLLSQRADAMTKPVQSNRWTAPLRAAAEYTLPKRVAEGVNTFLGGRQTGEQIIKDLTSDRNVAAAERVLTEKASPKNDINQFKTAMEKAMAERQAVVAERQAARAADDAAIEGLLTSENVTPRSGPLRNLDAGFGMKAKDTDALLTELAASSPEAKALIDKLYQVDGRVSRKALMGLSDIIEKRTGMTFVTPKQNGLLNSTPVGKGALSEASSPEVNITNYVRGLSDDEVKAIIGKDADTAGRTIKNPRKFATGKLEKLVEDARKGVELDPQDLALLKERGLM